MSDTKIRAPRADEVLKADHERVKILFAEYEEFGDDSALTKQGIFDQIQRELEVHVRLEEEVFYPALAELDADVRDRVLEALQEHRILWALLSEFSQLAPDGREFDAAIQALRESVDRHAEEEERQIFPFFGTLDPEQRDRISDSLWRRKTELSGGEAWEGPSAAV